MQIQNLLRPLNKRFSPGVLAGIFAFVLTAVGWLLGIFGPTDLTLDNMRASFGTVPASGETVIVGVDQEALAYYGGWPIARHHSATVLNRIAAAGARRVYVDSSFAVDSQPDADAALEGAFERLGSDRVALPIVTLKGKPDERGVRQPVEIVSIERFINHASIVSADMPIDRDSCVRSMGLTSFDIVANQPSVPAWLAYGRDAKPGMVKIDYSINEDSIPVISFKDIALKGVPENALRDKNVIVGLVAERVTQPVLVPRYGKLERAKFMALATETLTLGREPQPASMWMMFACTALLAVLLGMFFPRLGLSVGAAITLLVVVLLFVLGIEVQRRTQLSLPIALPIASVIFTYLGCLIATHPDFHAVRQAGMSLIDKVDYGLAKLFHSGVDAIITFTPDGRILTVNETAEKMFDVKADDVLGKPLSTVLPDAADALLNSASGHQPGRLEATVNNDSGQGKHVDLAFNAVPSEEGWVGYASIRDITEMKAREDELKRQATHDAMTGLPNRAAFQRHLDATRRFATETGNPFAVFLMDLNKFKQVNDTLGHHVGDALLIEVAKRFQETVRKGDFVARLGGDEFAVVVAPPSDRSNAEWLASRMVDSLADLNELEGHPIATGTSIGVSLFPEHAQTSDDLVRIADEAMYIAKRGGDGYAVAEVATAETTT